MLRFLPWYYRADADIHQEIHSGDTCNRNKYAARNIFLRICNLPAKVTNIIVAKITVNCFHTSLAKCYPECGFKKISSGSRNKMQIHLFMCEATENNPTYRDQYTSP